MAIAPEEFGGELIISQNALEKSNPSVAGWTSGPNNDGYVVVWKEAGVSEASIFAQRFDAFGNETGSRIHVGANVLGDYLYDPQVATLPDGGFVVSWHDTIFLDAASTSNTYMMSIFDASGDPVTSVAGAFSVSRVKSNSQRRVLPSAVALTVVRSL